MRIEERIDLILSKHSRLESDLLSKQLLIYFGYSSRIDIIINKMAREYGVYPDFIVDNNPELAGKRHNGIKIVGFSDLLEMNPTDVFILITARHFSAISKQLGASGFYDFYFRNFFYYKEELSYHSIDNMKESRDEIVEACYALSDVESRDVFFKLLEYRVTDNIFLMESINKGSQYFDPFFNFNNREVFVDCGAYTGDTIFSFVEKVRSFEKIYAFEPNPNVFNILKKNVCAVDGDVELFELGVSNRSCTLAFSGGDTGGSFAMSKGSDVRLLEVCALNDKLDRPATFIKMDIEGEELNAIMGASDIIRSFKPKLAISAYHKSNDLWEIINRIKHLNKSYEVGLRHHSKTRLETVIYAR